MPRTNSSGCLLLSLPAELRELIYHFHYNSSSEDGNELDLLHPDPPTKDLLLTCKQAYNETAQIYRAAYRHYWSESRFVLGYPTASEAQKATVMGHEQDIAHVNHVRVITQASRTFELVHRNAGWKEVWPDGTILYVRLRPWLSRRAVDPRRLACDYGVDENKLRATCNRIPSSLTVAEQMCLLWTVGQSQKPLSLE